MKIIVVGNPIGVETSSYLTERNIPFINIDDLNQSLIDNNDKILFVKSDTDLSDLIKVLEDRDVFPKPFIIEPLPNFPEPIVLKEDNKPFYHDVFSKGGKKNKKRFGR